MPQHSETMTAPRGSHDRDAPVRQLAHHAIADLLHRRTARDVARGAIDAAMLADAAIARDPAALASALHQLAHSGLRGDEVTLDLLPQAARHLGALWAEDRLGFAEVTLGSARIQNEMLRRTRDAVPATLPAERQVTGLMVVPRGEDHMLGAIAACHLFERAGLRMGLALGAELPDLTAALHRNRPSFVGFSISCSKSMDLAISLVEKLFETLDDPVPTILGGPAAVDPPPRIADLPNVHFSSDPDAVIDLLNIRALVAPEKQAMS